jgi:hypothetical protein
MQRRKFCQYSALASASFLVNFGLLNHKRTEALLSKSMNKKPIYDWIILYWMPYDNNLSRFGSPILEMLTKGVNSDNIIVGLQGKFSGSKNISRNLITSGTVETQTLEATNSSSEEVFAEYLNWAKSEFDAKKWAIVCLGHGGRLDEISPDEHPISGVSSATKWMNIQKLSNIIASFNKEVDNRIELFFFQNCNKGTIEANYTFRNTAKYTLSSQLELGAPNYYYEPLLKFLGSNPDINGGQLASKIMEYEAKDMYQSYTAVNNRAVAQLPAQLNPLIELIVSSNLKDINFSGLKTYNYMGDRFVDLVDFFQTITKQLSLEQQKYLGFLEFLNNSLIYKVQKNGTRLGSNTKYQNLSGLGMLFPRSRAELEKYRYLQVFSDLKLVKLFDAILFN